MKILLVEDDQATRDALTATLKAHHYAVDAVADGATALYLSSQWAYDLILLDIVLPQLNGIDVCRQLRAESCQTPILMLTVKTANEDIVAGLDAGADDYVSKLCDSSQLLARVRALLRRRRNIEAATVLTWGELSLNPVSAQVQYREQAIALRPKEYNLLQLFLRHPQRIFSRNAIIDQLWSIDDPPVEASITNLIKDLRQRLKAAGVEGDLIETVYGLGYRLRSAPPPAQAAADSPSPVSPTAHPPNDWAEREQQGAVALQAIAERFQVSLAQRLADLAELERSLQSETLTAQRRTDLIREVHKLAGGLGTFGYTHASDIVQKMEDLLIHTTQPAAIAPQFSALLAALLAELKQDATPTPTVTR